MKYKPTTLLPFSLASALSALLASTTVHADQIWDGGSIGPGDNNWNTAANWGLDALPIFTNAINFGGNLRNAAVNNLAADSIIGGINFTNNGTAGNTNAFTLSGARITLGGNITTTAASSAITDIISLNMILDANRAITTNTNHNLTVSGLISEIGGARTLTKDGAGILTLSNGSNSYTGGTGLNAGTLSFVSGALGTTGNITFTGNSTLQWASGNTQDLSARLVMSNGVTSTFDTNGNNVVFATSIGSSSTGALTKVGTGTLQFNSVPTHTGTTTINAGIVEVRAGTAGGSAVWGSGPITLSQGAQLFFNPTNQAIQNTGGFTVGGPITLSGGAGTSNLRFAGNDNKFVLSGGITGEAGVAQTLAISQGGSGNGDRLTTQITGAIANGLGGTLGVSVDFAGSSGIAQRSYANLSGANTFTGNLTVTNSRGLNGTGTHPGAWLTIGGLRHDGFSAPTLVSVGTGYLGSGADYSGDISISNGSGGLTTLAFLTSANQILRGVISGTGSLHQGGTGTLTLNAANTFSGNTTVAGGKIILGNALALQHSAYVTTGSNGSTIGIDLTGYTTPTLGGLSGAVNLASAFTGGYSSVSNLTLNPQAGNSATYSGNITNAAMILTKTGAGTQVLTGTNTYGGGTNLSNGMLQFGRLVSQSATGAVAVTGGTLAVNLGGTGEWTTGTSGNGTIGGLLAGLGGQSGGTVTYAGNVALGFDTTNGFVNPNGIATQTYSGAIANVGTTLGITKLGTNILILSGNNTYTGATTVNAGRLVLTGTNSYTGGSVINGGMLQFGKLTAQPASGAVAVGTGGTLAVNLGGAGEWTTGTSGNGTIGGLLAGLGGQSGGTVSYSGAVALGFDTSNAASTQTYGNAIANVGTTLGIAKLGTGTLSLTGVNTYTGATTVNGGTLLLDKTGTSGTAALASTSVLVLGGGNFQMLGKASGTTTQTLGALTLTANTNNTITLDSSTGTGTTLTLANSGPTRGVGSSLLIDRTIANTTLTTTLGLAAGTQTSTQAILGYALVKDATGIGFATNVGGNIVRYTGADTTTSASSNSATTNYKITPTGTTTSGAPLFTTAASPSFNSLHIDTASATGANFLSLNGTVTLTQRALLMTGNNNFTIQSGTLGSSNSEVIVHQAGTGTLTISSLISSGTGSLTKDGTGTLIVTNASNAYNGSTTLNAGTLQYADNTAFGTSTLYLAGGTKLQKITEEANFVGNAMANNIILTGGQVEMNVDFTNAKDQWYTGVISGLGSLRVTGSGTFARSIYLNGNNTFTGGVTLDTSTTQSAWIALVNANGLGTGTLTINHTGGAAAQGLGATADLTSGSGVSNNIVINPGATFNLGGPSATTGNMLLSGVISGSGNLNKSDAAAKTYILGGTAANTYSGTTTISSGILALNKTAGVNAIAGAITLGDGTGNDILRLDASNQIADASVITFNAATGANAGIFRLNNQSETVAGIASTGGGGIIENESGSAATGTLTVNNSVAQSFSGIIRNGDGSGTDGTLALTKDGIGTLTLSGTNLYTGATNVNAGTLIVNGSISASSLTTVLANATLGGIGTLGNTVISGIHSPGNSPGIQIFAANLTYEANSTVMWELVANSTAGRGTNFDGINVGGVLDFNGATTLDLNFNFGASAVEWQNAFWANDYIGTNGWLVYSGATSLTDPGNLSLSTPSSWLDESGDTLTSVRTNGTFSLFLDGNNIYLNYTIPEPSTALLGGLGLLALLRRRR